MVATCSAIVLVRQQSGVDVRVQRLHPSAEDLGEPGDLVDRRHGHTEVTDAGGGGARRHDLDAGLVQPAGQLVQTGLVVHADQRSPYDDLGTHGLTPRSTASGSRRTVVSRRPGRGSRSRVLVVADLDGNRHLRDERAGVDPLVHPVDGDAGARRRRRRGRRGSRARPGTPAAVRGGCSPRRKRRTIPASRMRMKPASTTRSGARAASSCLERPVPRRHDRDRSPGATVNVSMPACEARCEGLGGGTVRTHCRHEGAQLLVVEHGLQGGPAAGGENDEASRHCDDPTRPAGCLRRRHYRSCGLAALPASARSRSRRPRRCR